jgi:hypothetical protein
VLCQPLRNFNYLSGYLSGYLSSSLIINIHVLPPG